MIVRLSRNRSGSWVFMRSAPAPAKLARRNGSRRSGGLARLRFLLIGATACFGLAACAVGPDYLPPDPPMPANFVAASAAAKQTGGRSGGHTVDPTHWWRALHDRELDSLVERAVAGSPTLEVALNRLQEARAQEAVVVGMALPALEGTDGGALGTGSDLARGRASPTLVSAQNGAGFTQVNNLIGFDAGWELDLFGKLRREIEAAHYDVEAALAARNVVLISLIADVARAYLEMRALQMQLAVLRKSIEVARHYLDFVQERFNRGITNELDVTLAQRELGQLESQVAPLIARIDAARYVIAVLLGDFPETLARELRQPGALPALPARIQPGLPIELLRRRPDVAEAERQLASATALIGVATAQLFPQVAVTGSFGAQQGRGVTAAAINPIWSVGPAVAVPLLDFGRLDAAVERADFRSRELLFNYKQTVLNAVREVDAAVGAFAAQEERLRYLSGALVAARRAISLAQQRFERGLTDSLNVIDAQRQAYELEQQYVIAQASAAGQFVTLYRSLGGGWEPYQAVPPIPQPMPAILAAFKRLLAPDTAP